MNKAKVAFTLKQNEAISFMIREHKTQRRVGTVLPYVVHPMEVASYAGRFYPENQDLILAAYLHDVLEDTDVEPLHIELAFGSRVLELVQGVTAPDEEFTSWRARRQHQIDKLAASDLDIVRLKACDMLSNATSIGFDYKFRPNEGYAKFKKSPEDVIWYYLTSCQKIEDRLSPKEPVVLALRQAIGVWG